MTRILEFSKTLTFGLACFGIACLIMTAVIWSHPPSALGSLTGMDAFYYIMKGKGDLHPIAVVLIVLAITLVVFCVSSIFGAIAIVFSGKGQSR
jgi:hypothetical protein